MLKLITLILTVTPVLAQQQSPEQQALANKLMSEINASLTCEAARLNLQAELAKAQARIKELEDAQHK